MVTGNASARILLVLCLLLPTIVRAETVRFKAVLEAKTEVPPNESQARGRGEFLLDTVSKQLTYTIVYQGLSTPAIAGHIHGPAAQGTNAAVVILFPSVNSPISGTATLNDAQVDELMKGLFYVNINTVKNMAGEIRGQITK